MLRRLAKVGCGRSRAEHDSTRFPTSPPWTNISEHIRLSGQTQGTRIQRSGMVGLHLAVREPFHPAHYRHSRFKLNGTRIRRLPSYLKFLTDTVYAEPVFRQAEKEWKAFIEVLTDRITEADPQIPHLPPKDVIHRIYRDVSQLVI